ncbi:MAG: threonine dehydratase [Parasphingorhabdus sp.]|jgi:threonine dehydratase
MAHSYLKSILTSRVYDVARETELSYASKLSRRLNCNIWLKREDQQDVFSFKIRGAYNKMARTSPEILANGVVAASAGNHAQGVAYAARKLKCQATIFMPITTPTIKSSAVRQLGAKVRLVGDNFDETATDAHQYCVENKLLFVPPYDDPDVIAGQGTIALEILSQHSGDLDAIFIPVGGGGLISGISTLIKELRPDVKIIGVEPEDAASMTAALAQKRRVRLAHVGQFADGVAVGQAGKEPFRICLESVDDMITVNTDEICAAIKDIFEDTRSIMEAAGALSIAGLKKYVKQNDLDKSNLIAIASGANMNFDRLRHVSERAEIGELREAILSVTIPEKPGSFRRFCRLIGKRNVTEFNYRYAQEGSANIYVGLQIQDRNDIRNVIDKLENTGYATVDLTDNEMAKLHIRHMVGGRATEVTDEMLFRLQFPERPGALSGFLDALGENWNISLFHYRSHGADFGRILCGIQVPRAQRKSIKKLLNSLDYPWSDESDNVAYRLFLS